MAMYITREGPSATVNVWASLTTCGSQGTVNAITVPGGMNSIQELRVVFCEPVPADTSGGIMCVRLTGPGLKYGDQTFVCGGLGREETGSSSYTDGMVPVVLKVQIAVNSGSDVWVQFGQYGTDDGTPELAATLVFTENSAPERYYRSRMAACGTLDSETFLTAEMDQTLNAFNIPSTAKKIYSIITTWGGIELATATGGTGFVRLRGGIKQGEQTMCAGACANLSTTTGVSGGYKFAVQVPTDLDLIPGGQILAYGVQDGVDWGTPYFGVTLEMGA